MHHYPPQMKKKLSKAKAKKLRDALPLIRNLEFRAFVEQAILKAELYGDTRDLETAMNIREWPVKIREFIEGEDYMNMPKVIWPLLMPELEAMNHGDYQEVVLTGSIGVAKTTLALYSQAYQLYVLSCFKNPHKMFGLDPASEIEIVFQSISATLAKAVNYDRFKAMIENSPYFQKKFMYDKNILSSLNFPNRIIVKPISGSELASIGQNVIGGIIDELNFMAVIENSKKSVDTGVYDQAVENYNSIARRRKNRFMIQGKLPGLLCLVSSKRYPGQFTDIKEEEALRDIAEHGKSSIYVYDKRIWEIRPENFKGSSWFDIFIGDLTRKPFIIDEDDREISREDQGLLMSIPEEYRNDFRQDMLKALRDIAGVSTMASAPYIMNVDAIAKIFDNPRGSIFSRDQVDFKETQLGIVKNNIIDTDHPRFVHIDLGLTADAAGFVVGHVPEFMRLDYDGMAVWMPKIQIDGTLRITPPANGEINFEKIRQIIYKLTSLGMNIRWITFDSYQSVDSMQILHSKGYMTGNQSMDKTTLPYDIMKTALLEERLFCTENDRLQMELIRLERTPKGKIDHPPQFTKDIADALAGVAYGLTTQRWIWALHNIPVSPALVQAMAQSSQEDEMVAA